MSQWIAVGLHLAHVAGLAGFAGTLIGLAVIGVGDHPQAGIGAVLVLTLLLVVVAVARRPRLRQNAAPKARSPASAHEFPS